MSIRISPGQPYPMSRRKRTDNIKPEPIGGFYKTYQFCYKNHPVLISWNLNGLFIEHYLNKNCNEKPAKRGFYKLITYRFYSKNGKNYILSYAEYSEWKGYIEGTYKRSLNSSEYDLELLNIVRDYFINKYGIILEYLDTTTVKNQEPNIIKEQKPHITESTPQKSNSLLWLFAGIILIFLLINKK